ncbi:hypothetical protein [uncultured Methanobrevibacter sp.]|uniref:hypothetical protein n=1 Tax=uncultured Methanobrevibacter sp. TaxID=253161 RepID=UPI0025CD2FF1|nr:hypothetical protein [uncultured Methanobrevibacter sp.]
MPEDEVHTLKQLYFLLMMAFCLIIVLYSFIFAENDILYFAIFDVVVSLFIAINFYKKSIKNTLILLLLIPYGSLIYLMFGISVLVLIEFFHIPVFIYFIKVYFDKFMEYTNSNGLGVTIIMVFMIIFISFFITQIVEHKNPLDALVMVSNAFTSNGYAVLGKSIPGKINSIFLVWGGYIISGAGTATLTAAILIRHFNKRVKRLEKIIEGEVEE